MAHADDPAIANLESIIVANSSLTDVQTTCAQFAQNVTLLQINGTNLFNACTTYPNISRDLDANTINAKFAADLATREITGGQVELSHNITTAVMNYLVKTCGNIKCDAQNSPLTCDAAAVLVNNSTLSADGVANCQQSICTKLVGLLEDNPDIGGIGVYLSYLFQILMALLIAGYIVFAFFRAIRQKKAIHNSEPFVDACVNFHRTQCWFVSTLVVAAFISLGSGTVSIVDLYLLLTVSLNGVALLSFILLCTMYFGKRSWYTLFLTLIGYILCTVFFFLALTMRTSNQYRIAPPWHLCWIDIGQVPKAFQVLEFINRTATLPEWFFATSFAYCTVVLCACIFVQIKGDPVKNESMANSHGKERLLYAAVVLVPGLGYLVVLTLQVFLLRLFFKLVDGHAWGFGQVIAATVWIPLIIDYIHDRFFQHRDKKKAKELERNDNKDEAKVSLVRPEYTSTPTTPGFAFENEDGEASDDPDDARSQRTMSYGGKYQRYRT